LVPSKRIQTSLYRVLSLVTIHRGNIPARQRSLTRPDCAVQLRPGCTIKPESFRSQNQTSFPLEEAGVRPHFGPLTCRSGHQFARSQSPFFFRPRLQTTVTLFPVMSIRLATSDTLNPARRSSVT